MHDLIVQGRSRESSEYSLAQADQVASTRNRAIVLHLDQDGFTVTNGDGLRGENELERE